MPPDPSGAAKGERADPRILRHVLPHLWPKGDLDARARVVAAVLCLVVAKVATVVMPYFYKLAIDALTTPTATLLAVPVGLILAYGAFRVASFLFAELRTFLFERVGLQAIRRIGLEVFEHVHALSLRFHLDRQTGGLSRTLSRGTGAITTLLSFATFNLVPTLVEILLVAVILWFVFDIWFAAVTLGTVALYIWFSWRLTEWRIAFVREQNELDDQVHTRAIDSFLNYETVKYFGNEAFEAERYDRSLQRHMRAAEKARGTLALLNIGQSAIVSVGTVAVMWMAADGIVAGRLTVGDFVMVNAYLIQLYQPLGMFGFVYRELKQALVDMEKMFRLLGENQEIADPPGAPDLVVSGAELRFEGVAFGYDPRRPILEAVDFTVPPGKTVAVVGPSGAGKSTLARLIFRFYDVTKGAIRIDGQDIRQVGQASVRRAIGIVPQDTVLFNDTLRYNIAYGRPDATEPEIDEAARLANLAGFVAGLPDGWETRVGERGLKLSGGEKQRVAIARAILKRPAIFLFDEATSALDTRTEREIQANLRAVSRGRTTLVIAHRLSTIVDADEILVLDHGRIAERGDHPGLLARGGLYAAMWARQQEGERPAAAAAAG